MDNPGDYPFGSRLVDGLLVLANNKRLSENFRLPYPNAKIVDLKGLHLFGVLEHRKAGNSTHHYLRRLHNYALHLGWLLAPVMADVAWPVHRSKKMTAISREEEHLEIVAREQNLGRIEEWRHDQCGLWTPVKWVLRHIPCGARQNRGSGVHRRKCVVDPSRRIAGTVLRLGQPWSGRSEDLYRRQTGVAGRHRAFGGAAYGA